MYVKYYVYQQMAVLVQYRVYSASGDSFAVWTQRGEHLLLS
jgi:hypothetical protein